jgi:hypothetical protein
LEIGKSDILYTICFKKEWWVKGKERVNKSLKEGSISNHLIGSYSDQKLT